MQRIVQLEVEAEGDLKEQRVVEGEWVFGGREVEGGRYFLEVG